MFTIKQLQEAYSDYFKLDLHNQGERFGQYVFNTYNYEVGNSYNIKSVTEAYNVLYKSLVTTLDEILDEENPNDHN